MAIKSLNNKNTLAHLPRLSFEFDRVVVANSRILEYGKIELNTESSNLLFKATSGLPGFQSFGSSWTIGKGRIPTCFQAKIPSYFVATKPVPLPNTKGVNGNFYPITPFVVKSEGRQRSDLGLHYDSNVPGSSGCLVFPMRSHWRIFEVEMLQLFQAGVREIPLLIF